MHNFSNVCLIKRFNSLEIINICSIIKKDRLRAIAPEDEERDKDEVEEKFSTIFPLKSQVECVVRGTWISLLLTSTYFLTKLRTIYWVPHNDERELIKELPA